MALSSVHEIAPYGPALGLEAVFEYRNLRLNDRHVGLSSTERAVDLYRVTEITGLDDISLRHSSEPNPSAHGSMPLTDYYGERVITLSGRIEAGNLAKMRAMQRDLRTAFSSLQEEWLYIRSLLDPNQDVMLRCRKQSLSMPENQQNQRYHRSFQITLVASYPFFRSTALRVAQQGFSALTRRGRIYNRVYPLVYNTPIDSLGNIVVDDEDPFNIINLGDWPAEAVVTITGGVVNPQIVNSANNQVMKLQGTIDAGVSVSIDTLARTVKQNDGTDRFALVASDSDWLVIEPGVNQITLQADSFFGAGPNAVILYFDTYQ